LSDVSALGHVYTLTLSTCDNVSDVSALGHVHTLNLYWCANVSDEEHDTESDDSLESSLSDSASLASSDKTLSTAPTA
jgi:hypothetical protein